MRTPQLTALGQQWRIGEIAEELKGAVKNLPTTDEESRIEKLRRMMGGEVSSLSDSELKVFITEFSFLLDSWIDEYERTAFDGKTLKQLLREG